MGLDRAVGHARGTLSVRRIDDLSFFDPNHRGRRHGMNDTNFETQIAELVTRYSSWSVTLYEDDHGRGIADIQVSQQNGPASQMIVRGTEPKKLNGETRIRSCGMN